MHIPDLLHRFNRAPPEYQDQARQSGGGLQVGVIHRVWRNKSGRDGVCIDRHHIGGVLMCQTTIVVEQQLDDFARLIGGRDIPAVANITQQFLAILDQLDKGTPNGARLLGRLAVAADLGYVQANVVQNLLLRFPQAIERELNGLEGDCLRITYGICEFLNGDIDLALKDFDHVLSAGYEDKDPNARILAMSFKGRCQSVQGDTVKALETIRAARELAERRGRPLIAHAIRVKEGRLAYQLGYRSQALLLFHDAREGLKATNDYLSLASASGYEGKMWRRMGHYDAACESLISAVELWKEHHCRHRYCARDLAQLGLTKLLQARRLEAELNDRNRSRARHQRQAREIVEAFPKLISDCEDNELLDALTPNCQKAVKGLFENWVEDQNEAFQRRKTSDSANISSLRKEAPLILRRPPRYITIPCSTEGSPQACNMGPCWIWTSKSLPRPDPNSIRPARLYCSVKITLP